MFALLAAVVAFIWFVCDLADISTHFPFLPLFLALFALQFAYAVGTPGWRRNP